MDGFISHLAAFGWLHVFLLILLGVFIGWLFFKGKKVDGDLSLEGEGALRAESDSLRTRVRELEGQLSKSEADAAAQVADTSVTASDDDETYALEWRNRYLAARVKYLEGRLTEAPAPKAKKKAAAKKPAAKKTAAKAKAAPRASAKPKTKAAPKAKAPTKAKAAPKTKAKPAASKTAKKPGPKPGTKRTDLTKDGKVRQKPGPKSTSEKKSKAELDMDKYFANVKKYDSKATRKRVEAIVKHCGASLRSRDSSLVACSDETEVKTVMNNFVKKKLGVKDGAEEIVRATCTEMKPDRFKSRVTFYYLCAKRAGKLSMFE